VLFQYSVAAPQATVNESLSQHLEQQRRQNALSQVVQDTKPEFLQEFRRLNQLYDRARAASERGGSIERA
jgi:hypothetical protein